MTVSASDAARYLELLQSGRKWGEAAKLVRHATFARIVSETFEYADRDRA